METKREIRLEPGWKSRLEDEFAQPYMAALRQFLLERKRSGAAVYPPGALIFNALDSTPFDSLDMASAAATMTASTESGSTSPWWEAMQLTTGSLMPYRLAISAPTTA